MKILHSTHIGNQVLIVSALAGFIRSFLENDILILQSMGYEVHCAANKEHPGAGDIDGYFRDRHVVFHQVDFSSNRPISKESLQAWKQIRTLMNNNDFELVHCHTPIAGALLRIASRRKRKLGTKIIYTTHGFYFHKGSSKKSWLIYYTIEKIMSKFSDMIITINNEDFKNAKNMYCKDVQHINGVGVDISKFTDMVIDKVKYREAIGVGKDELMVLAVGELSRRKNHQIVIKALGKLKLQNAVFVLCGNAMTESATTDLIKELSKENDVRTILLGLRSDIPAIYRCADIGVMPSTREGLGLSGIEMLASGLPIVAANLHGILDYMHNGENGYLCNPYDENEFAEGIRKLLDLSTREIMKPFCIESSRPFDKKISNSQMKKIYHDILQKTGGTE